MKQVNTFKGGMNMDIGNSYVPNDTYLYAENFILNSDGNNQDYEINNPRGNTHLFDFPILSDAYMITIPSVNPREGDVVHFKVTVDGKTQTIYSTFGVSSVNDFYKAVYEYIKAHTSLICGYSTNGVYITTVGHSSFSIKAQPGNGCVITSVFGTSRLFRPQVVGYCDVRDELYIFTASSISSQIWHIIDNSPVLLYHNKLNLSTDYPVKAIGYYNNDNNIRAYFTDGSNNLHQCDLSDPNLLSWDPKEFDIINPVRLTRPTVDGFGSGNIKCGVVQYAYQLFKLNGPQTKFSDLSYMVPLSDSAIADTNSRNFTGGDIDVSSGKSCNVTITGIDTAFDFIRVVSVFSDTLHGIPVIKIVSERSVPPTGELSITDTGNENLGTYTLEEFNTIGGTLFKCQDICIKNNILVAGNIEEDFFDVDFDFRAYRADVNGTIKVWDSTGRSTTVSNYTLPETHDAIQSKLNQATYKYNEDGNLGASGTNVKIEFRIKQITLDDMYASAEYTYSNKTTALSTGFTTNTSYGNYASPYNSQFVGYQRDEVYSFGVVLVDERGRNSFVKWVCDLRFPGMWDEDNKTTYESSANFSIVSGKYANILYPYFTFKNVPINPNTGLAYELKVVRCKREQTDRTIVTQGLLIPNDSEDGYEYPLVLPAHYVSAPQFTSKNYVISPEEIIGNIQGGDQLIGNNDTLRSLCKMSTRTKFLSTSTFGYAGFAIHKHSVTKFSIFSSGDAIGTILDSAVMKANTITTIGSSQFRNGYVGTQPIHKCSTKSGIVTTGFSETVQEGIGALLVNIERNVQNQYGGNSYDARTSREYIDCVQSNGAVFGGDTYISIFDYLSRYLNTDFSWSVDNYMFENYFFPCETTINLAYRTDYSYGKSKGNPTGNPVRLQELAGFYTDGSISYTQDKDLFLFNTVYKKENDVRTMFPKPLTYTGIKKYDTRVLASERKVLNEETDSWTVFLPQNYLDLDTTFGPINACVNEGNNAVCFQDKAISVVSIDDRSLIQDNNTSQLVLGTGAVLARYDYVSTMIGCKHKWSTIKSPVGTFFYDKMNDTINILSSTSISSINGIRSFLLNRDDNVNPHDLGVHGYYNHFNRELVYSFGISTLSINVPTLTAQCFYGFYSPQYIRVNDKVYSVKRSDSDSLYEHNIGEYNTFYGRALTSSIRMCINKDYSMTKTFDSCMCDFEEKGESALLKGFFTKIKAWNSYQYTSLLNFTFNETLATEGILYTKKQKSFSFFIPRNAVNLNADIDGDIFNNTDLSRRYRERMKDKFLVLELQYNGANKASMRYLITNFRYIYE